MARDVQAGLRPLAPCAALACALLRYAKVHMRATCVCRRTRLWRAHGPNARRELYMRNAAYALNCQLSKRFTYHILMIAIITIACSLI